MTGKAFNERGFLVVAVLMADKDKFILIVVYYINAFDHFYLSLPRQPLGEEDVLVCLASDKRYD